jgi:hypothetical protein
MNIKFNRLNKPRIVSFASSLIGQSVPERTKNNSSVVGVFIDNLVRKFAGASTGITTGVDLQQFGIEVKSQDIQTGSDWTIGTMTFDDLINTPYISSSIYQKLQALLLIKYDNKLRVITSANLYYLDNDEVQSIFEKAYEAARTEAISHQLNFKSNLNQQVIVFGDEDIKFSNSHRFKGTPGYCFEFNNSGTSFKFRISNKEMKRVARLATATNHALFDFS